MTDDPRGPGYMDTRYNEPRWVPPTIGDAREYVGTTPTSGVAQLALLALEGLDTESRVLEYGCGPLHLARVLVPYLWPHRYCAVEPNGWLVDAARADDPRLDDLLDRKAARFRQRADFDASWFDRSFDLVFAHSVVSHMGAGQLPEFVERAAAVLAPMGRVLFSYREGPDTGAAGWTYPEATFFSWDSVLVAAAAAGLRARPEPSYRALYSAACPDEVHDWAVLEWS